MPTVTWYDFGANAQATPDMDYISQIKGLIGRMETAIKDNHIKGDVENAKRQVATLKASLIAA